MLGKALPSWLLNSGGPVLLRRFVRNSKHDPVCDEVTLVQANNSFSRIKYPDGRETNVSTGDLAPCPDPQNLAIDHQLAPDAVEDAVTGSDSTTTSYPNAKANISEIETTSEPARTLLDPDPNTPSPVQPEVRRSTRQKKIPLRYGDLVPH